MGNFKLHCSAQKQRRLMIMVPLDMKLNSLQSCIEISLSIFGLYASLDHPYRKSLLIRFYSFFQVINF